MSLFSLTQCCKVLGIDLSTLRRWLQQAQLPLVPHPTDARLKCLTREQVQQLAVLHGRLLAPQTAPASAVPAVSLPPPAEETPPGHTLSTAATGMTQETDLLKQLSCLETRVATLSEQVAQLALLLLHERDHTIESRLSQLETTIQALLVTIRSSSHPPDHEATVSNNERVPEPQVRSSPSSNGTTRSRSHAPFDRI